MAALSGDLRGQLERSIVAAREESERAARAALETLGVERREAFPGISDEDRRLRVQLRTRARQLGEGTFEAGIEPLVEEIAYEGWHRMLFARFLAENNLLMHPSGVAVTLEECAELAREEGEPDEWMVAARYASAMLPGIFRQDDPSSRVRFAPEGRSALERILNELPPAVFRADDALGWVYQFWQSRAKKAVNDSGVKIGAKELPAVTQLFTEDYMVRFLLENSLGAWWFARHPESPLIKEWEYLRFQEDGTPAAGRFEGWPECAAEVTVMDPCCGSGHFLVVAFDTLRKMRMEEEGLSEAEAGDAVLRDNVHGLEIDPRCTQLAAFALAISAWKAGGYRELPLPTVACSGVPVKGQIEEWISLAGADVNLRMTLERLYELFKEAPTLGSLIDPASVGRHTPIFGSDYSVVAPVIARLLANEATDSALRIFAGSAQGVAAAAYLMANTYTLVTTNVPYLARTKQASSIRDYCRSVFADTASDLATTFLDRCLQMASESGSVALVTPQNWLFLSTYVKFRRRLLAETSLHFLARLGPKAFQTPMWDFNILLSVMSREVPNSTSCITGVDAASGKSVWNKDQLVRNATLRHAVQSAQVSNPGLIITIDELTHGSLLAEYASAHYGSKPGQTIRVTRKFWELARIDNLTWVRLESAPSGSEPYSGKSEICLSLEQIKRLGIVEFGVRGREAWGHEGLILSQMGSLPCCLYVGSLFDNNTSVILPRNQTHLPAIFGFVRSNDFREAVRQRNQKLDIDTNSMVNVPFDLEHWQKVAEEAGPLPEPYSNDPTQWLFKGSPAESSDPLQVAVARLLGYAWPEQGGDHVARLADEDGVVPLVPVLHEEPAGERLRALLAAAFGDAWSTDKQAALLSQVGYGGKDLSTWLRDGFFLQHAKLFRNRPFIWHIWDGLRDEGFSALVNYHKLDTSALERLIYTYLGAWIDRQRGERDADVVGAEGRLVAALNLQRKLIAIRGGEPPYDIYVRWKPKHEQPIGWDPDLNDGVRLNIRPFVEAGVLRSKFTVNWNKDRGTNPDGTERLNDLHLTLAEKRAARAEAGVA